MIKKISLFAIVFLIALFNVKGQTPVVVTPGATVSFGVPATNTVGTVSTTSYQISAGAGYRVVLSGIIYSNAPYDKIIVYETNDNFTERTLARTFQNTNNLSYTSSNGIGKLIVDYVTTVHPLVNSGFSVSCTSITTPLNFFPSVGGASMGSHTSSYNFVINDPIMKASDMLLISSGGYPSLSLGSQKIYSNTVLMLSSSGSINFTGSDYLFGSGSNIPFRIFSSGRIALNNTAASTSIINARINGTQNEGLMTFSDDLNKYQLLLGNGGAATGTTGGGWFPIVGGKTIDVGPGLYIYGDQKGGSTGGTLPNGNGILVFDGRWNGGAAPAAQPVVDFRSGEGARLAHITGEGSFYVKKDLNAAGAVNAATITATTVTAKEVNVTAQPADFVFEKDYQLRTVEEVDKYVTEHKHLPDVPSAKKMEEDGVNLAEMNKVLLQKVEELTLYIIDQEKRIKILETAETKVEQHK